ncbi:MAG: hypothetical protein WC455_09790 [Dehalococcoidia bacterium]
MTFTRQFVSELAEKAVKAYIKDGKTLNAAIVDIAASYDLNVEQVKRLCEAVNLATKEALGSPKAVFDLADSTIIIDELQPKPAPDTKEASMSRHTELKSLDGLRNAILADGESIAAFEASLVAPTEKTASIKVEQTQGSAVKAIYDGICGMMNKVAQECYNAEIDAEVASGHFINTLVKEGNARGSINHSYSVLLKLADNQKDELRIKALYRRAYEKVASMSAWRRPIEPLAEITVDGIPNANSSLFKSVKGLLKSAEEIDIRRRVVQKLQEKKASILRVLIEGKDE